MLVNLVRPNVFRHERALGCLILTKPFLVFLGTAFVFLVYSFTCEQLLMSRSPLYLLQNTMV